MRHGLYVGFLIVVAPSHLVLALSFALPQLNRTEYFWWYFLLWIVVMCFFACQVFTYRVLSAWSPARFFHFYYTLPLGLVTTIHLGYYALELPETRAMISTLQADSEPARGNEREIRLRNAPIQTPWRFLHNLGRLARVLLRRAYFFLRTVALSVPVWQWALMAAVSACFRRDS
jgi:hypothetical protein